MQRFNPPGAVLNVVPDVLVANRGAGAAMRFGAGELLYLSFTPPRAVAGNWQANYGTINAGPHNGEATFICPDAPNGRVTVTVRYLEGAPPHQVAHAIFDVVRPTRCFQRQADYFHYNVGPPNHVPNGGFLAAFVIRSDAAIEDVSFARLEIREVGGANRWVSLANGHGLLSNPPPAGIGLVGKRHDEDYLNDRDHHASMENWVNSGFDRHPRAAAAFFNAYAPFAIPLGNYSGVGNDGTRIGRDRVYNLVSCNFAWRAQGAPDAHQLAGSAELRIPLHFRVRGSHSPAGVVIQSNYHRLSVFCNGRILLSKGGITRSFNYNDPPHP